MASPQPRGRFVALPVFVTKAEDCVHYLFIRRHEARGGTTSDLPANRTLFITNLPPALTETSLRRLLEADFGRVEFIRFAALDRANTADDLPVSSVVQHELLGTKGDDGSLHGPGATAYAVFENERALAKLEALPQRERSLVDDSLRFGVRALLSEYERQRPDEVQLESHVNKLMARFEDLEHERKGRLDRQTVKPDADGFVTVTRRTKHHRTGSDKTGTATAASAASAKRAAAAKKKKNELVDFYRFQMRQTKRDEIAELRRKFEEDKIKIEKMKAARKFRPF